MATPLQRSGEYDFFFRMSPSALDQWWTLRTYADYVYIPLTRRTCRTGHQPGFSLPWRSGKPRADTRAKGSHVAADAARKNPLSKHAASERHAKHNHLAPHSFTRYLISGCHVWKTLLSYSHDTSPPTAVCRV